jgi:hypothetical protein
VNNMITSLSYGTVRWSTGVLVYEKTPHDKRIRYKPEMNHGHVPKVQVRLDVSNADRLKFQGLMVVDVEAKL